MSNDFITSIPIKTFSHTDVTMGFKVINPEGFPGALNYIKIENAMNVPVIISYDGQYGHEYIKNLSYIDLNVQQCCSQSNKRSLMKNKTKLYIKAVTNLPKAGIVVISGFYQH